MAKKTNKPKAKPKTKASAKDPKSTSSNRAKSKSTPKKIGTSAARTKNIAKHQTFKVTKKRIIHKKPLPGIRRLIAEPFRLMLGNKVLFTKLILIHSALVFVFLKGFGTLFNFTQTRQDLTDALGGEANGLDSGVALFSYVLTSVNSQASDAAGVYQFFITLAVILATIWVTRRLINGEKPNVKDGFYSGMFPLIPYMIVLFVIGLQLIPLVVGNYLLTSVTASGLAVTFVEKLLFILIFFAFAVLSSYMVLSSIIALNIVTLPDVGPMKALRSARELVLHRRIGVFARLIVLPLLLLLIAAVIFIPLIIALPVLVDPLFLLASSFGLVFFTVYMYNLYRLLL